MRQKVIDLLSEAGLNVRPGTVSSELYVSNGDYVIVVNLPVEGTVTGFEALIWAGTCGFEHDFVMDEGELLEAVNEAFEVEKSCGGKGMTATLLDRFPEIAERKGGEQDV